MKVIDPAGAGRLEAGQWDDVETRPQSIDATKLAGFRMEALMSEPYPTKVMPAAVGVTLIR